MKAFISYAREDQAEVRKYVGALRKEDVQIVWDEDIKGGTLWPDYLAEHISHSDALIVFVSLAALNSEFVDKEVLAAFNAKCLCIPVYLEDLAKQHLEGLMLILSGIQRIDSWTLGRAKALHKIIDALQSPRVSSAEEDMLTICVMGTKGGSGKSTFICAAAEIIASAGHSVLVIDADIQSSGLVKYLADRLSHQPPIWSMLDAAWARCNTTTPPLGTNFGLWDATPKYLEREVRFGKIYLIPGKLLEDDRPGTGFANIPAPEKPKAGLELLKGAISRKTQDRNISCVLIDSGAETNEFVSAGFVIARHPYIVSSPNPQFLKDIGNYETHHRNSYKEEYKNRMRVLVNMATPDTPVRWEALPGARFLHEDPIVRENSAKGTFDFDGLGFCQFYSEVLQILRQDFGKRDGHFLPDELDVWIRPRIKQLVEKKLPQRILGSFSFRVWRVSSVSALVVGFLLMGFCGYFNYQYAHGNHDILERMIWNAWGVKVSLIGEQLIKFAMGAGILTGLVLAPLGAWNSLKVSRRRKLLRELIEKGADGTWLRTWLTKLKNSRDKGELKWLKRKLDESLIG